MKYFVSDSKTFSPGAGFDLLELRAPTDACLVIHSVFVSQFSAFGDVNAEALRLTLWRVDSGATSGSGGQTPTIYPAEGGSPASGSSVETFNTTQMATGPFEKLHDEAWNIMIPFRLRYPEDFRPVISPGEYLEVVASVPSGSLAYSVACWFDEVGG